MLTLPSPLDERLVALDRARLWLDSAGQSDMTRAVGAGTFDQAIHRSGADGFTLAAVLISMPGPLSRAIKAGWKADKPCVFCTGGSGRAAQWLPVDAVVYEIGPVRQALEEESQGLEILGQGNAPMAEPNPMGETALHQAARCPIHSTGVGDGPNPVLRSLLALGFRVNALDARGRTPLHVARGACNILDLLRAGADTLAVDVRGMRAIDVVMARPEGPQACAMYERGLLCGSSMVSTVSRTKIRL